MRDWLLLEHILEAIENIWDVVDRDIPPLKSQTERILECLTESE